jgi:hypothetical protein
MVRAEGQVTVARPPLVVARARETTTGQKIFRPVLSKTAPPCRPGGMTLLIPRAGARPATRPWLGLALLLLPTALAAVDINVLFLALPALTADLRVSPVEQLWIVDSYGLVVGVLAIVAGSVGDRVGRLGCCSRGTPGSCSAPWSPRSRPRPRC